MKRILFMIALFSALLFVAFTRLFDVGPSDYAKQIALEGQARHQVPAEPIQPFSKSKDPKFPIGMRVYVKINDPQYTQQLHATVKKVVRANAYYVSFTPTNQPKSVTSYKWILNEEISNATPTGFDIGQRVMLRSARTSGMKGSIATIKLMEMKNVYQLAFDASDSSIPNPDQWYFEDELRAIRSN